LEERTYAGSRCPDELPGFRAVFCQVGFVLEGFDLFGSFETFDEVDWVDVDFKDCL
jgi:hypothetical protein